MTLETGVKALAEAVAVDVKALEDGKVDKELGKGLSDTNYTQVEKTKLAGVAAEATKNRADSLNADKVHTHTTAQVTGLGTAATANLTTSNTDATAGSALKVGDFGVGGNNPRLNSFDANDLLPGQRRSWSESFTEADAVSVNLPALGGNPTTPRSWHAESMGSEPNRTVQYATEVFGAGTVRGRTFVRVRHDSTWHPWQEIIRTGSLLQTAGSSTDFPMSQAATTNQLTTKADISTQVIAGTGLSGGGTLAANRTLTVSYGTTAGTAAQGNDSRITGALQTSQVVQATGTSTTNVMSQAVTTGQLETKAALRAASNIDGGVRMRLDGTTLYITNDGSDA